jgi:phosphohistidine phosphatase SixA
MFTSKTLGIACAIAALATPLQSSASEPTSTDLAKTLTDGGYVIYIRHAQTETDYADQVTADPSKCATQRVLSEAGWAQAKGLGEAFEHYAIPVGNVITSEYCRAWQTADLAFGSYTKTEALNFEKAEEYTEVQIETMRGNVNPLITASPQQGTNTVIVGHDDPFEAITGIYPEPQGVAYILKPNGKDGFEVLGHIDPDAWYSN